MSEIEDEITALTERIQANPNDAEAYLSRGALMWKLGRHGAALSDYNRAAALDPDGPGATAARGARNILSFTNPDLYNP